MDERRPNDTREFVAMWHAATQEPLTHRLTDALHRLSQGDARTSRVTRAEWELLAPHLLRALQVADHPDTGVHEAIEYLARSGEAGGP